MIGFLHPGVLYGLVLTAAPVFIHLLRTRRATRVQFPTIRFVPPSTTAAVRLRTPTDWLLLALRMSIVGNAVCAAAQPVLLTSSRLAAWNRQMARALIVDVSDSMRATGADGRRASEEAEEAAKAEQQGAAYFLRLDSRDVTTALDRAAAWLARTPPARGEVVIITDAQRSSLESADVSGLPRDVGLRFVEVGAPPRERTIQGFTRFGVLDIPARAQEVVLSSSETSVTLTSRPAQDAPGLRVLAGPREASDVSGLLKTVASAGAPGPTAEQPVTIVFPSGDQPAPTGAAVKEGWMLRTVLRLQQDAQLKRVADTWKDSRLQTNDAAARSVDDFEVIARDAGARPLITASASEGALTVAIGGPVSSLLAAATVRAVLAARQGPVEDSEAEVLRIPAGTLHAWSRPAGPVEQDAWRRADASDARWFWCAAVLLVLGEQWLRSRSDQQAQKEDRAAA